MYQRASLKSLGRGSKHFQVCRKSCGARNRSGNREWNHFRELGYREFSRSWASPPCMLIHCAETHQILFAPPIISRRWKPPLDPVKNRVRWARSFEKSRLCGHPASLRTETTCRKIEARGTNGRHWCVLIWRPTYHFRIGTALVHTSARFHPRFVNLEVQKSAEIIQ